MPHWVSSGAGVLMSSICRWPGPSQGCLFCLVPREVACHFFPLPPSDLPPNLFSHCFPLVSLCFYFLCKRTKCAHEG